MARPVLVALALLASELVAAPAWGMTLPEAIGLAGRTNPTLAVADARHAAAAARERQAWAGRLPTVTLSGEAAGGHSDLGGFFGFGDEQVSPSAIVLEIRQALYTGGAIRSAVGHAANERLASGHAAADLRAKLVASVAEAYAGVLVAQEVLGLNQAQVEQAAEIARQTELRFRAGEAPRTDLANAHARLAEARAGLAGAESGLAAAEARFVTVVGAELSDLAPLPEPPITPARLDEALAQAERSSPVVAGAEASLRAAKAAVRYAQAERLPSIALTAKASSVRDQFLPGYQADGMTVGVEGRWTLYDGTTGGKIAEARAGERAAQAALDAAIANLREAVVSSWHEVRAAEAKVTATAEQAEAARSARDSVRHEVRVGQKPTLDLLNAEKELLAARSALASARAARVVSAYRLNAFLGSGA